MSLTKSSLYLVAANVITLLVQMVSVKYYVKWLGEAQYSIVVFVLTISTYVVMVTPSTFFAALKMVTSAHNSGDHDKMWRIQRTQLWVNMILIGVLVVVLMSMGAFINVPKAHLTRQTVQLLFTGVLIGWIANFANETIHPVLASLKLFKALALRQTLDKLAGALCGLALTFIFRNPIALVWGTAMGAVAGLTVSFVSLKRAMPEFDLRPKKDHESFRELRSLLLKGHPHRVLTGAANSLDRLLIPYSALPIEALTRYSIGYRLPEVFQMLLYPITDPVLPDLTRALETDKNRFSDMVDRYGRLAMGMGVSLVMVPCAFGWQFIHVWLGYVPKSSDIVMLGIGVYFTVQLYMTMIGRAFFASGELQYAAVFSGLNAVLTGALTLPFIAWLKLPGVALMNALIATLTIVPYAVLVKRTIATQIPLAKHVAATFGWYVFGLLVTGGLYWVSIQPLLQDHPWSVVLLAPTSALAMMALGVKSGVFTIPDVIRKKIPFGLAG